MESSAELVVRLIDASRSSTEQFSYSTSARWVEDINGGPRTDQGVQPDRVSSDPPARLIGHHPIRPNHRLADGLLDRLAAGSSPEDRVDAAAATEVDTEKAFQAASDFAVRQTALLVEFDDRGLSIGTELSNGGTESVRSLQGMAPLNPAVALAALADVDVELSVNGLARNLNLKLLGDVSFVEGAAAARADVGQGRLMDLVDLFR